MLLRNVHELICGLCWCARLTVYITGAVNLISHVHNVRVHTCLQCCGCASECNKLNRMLRMHIVQIVMYTFICVCEVCEAYAWHSVWCLWVDMIVNMYLYGTGAWIWCELCTNYVPMNAFVAHSCLCHCRQGNANSMCTLRARTLLLRLCLHM